MKQHTLRSIRDLTTQERAELLDEMFEIGVRTSGPNSQFIRKGVYIPDGLDVGEYEKQSEGD